jgi:hypothetical protein
MFQKKRECFRRFFSEEIVSENGRMFQKELLQKKCVSEEHLNVSEECPPANIDGLSALLLMFSLLLNSTVDADIL